MFLARDRPINSSFIVLLLYFIVMTISAYRRHARRHVVPKIPNGFETIIAAHLPIEEECSEPDDLRNQILNSLDNIEDEDVDNGGHVFGSENAETGIGEEPKLCELTPEKSAEASVMRRSLCPWQWRMNFDEKRKPKFISEAKCLCRKSRGLSGSFCHPIRRRFAVLRRIGCDPNTKRFEYGKSVEVITVGYHSVLPRSKRARPLSAFYNKLDELDI